MKWLKLLLPVAGVVLTSCTTTLITEEHVLESPTAHEILAEKDVWYIAIHETRGNEAPNFMQVAFTLSFDRGVLLANNNLTGIGETGNGMGEVVGYYNISGAFLDIDHDLDGIKNLHIDVINDSHIRLTDRFSGVSYTLYGYYIDEFDYEAVFYDNIDYFLQEYEIWEKTYTSHFGAINEFDQENFLQFTEAGGDFVFRSSIDHKSVDLQQIFWDYSGLYQVYDVPGELYLKTLTLDYDFLNNDYFEVYVVDKSTIELFHPASGTVYEFTGRLPVRYLKPDASQKVNVSQRLRKPYTHPEMQVKRKRDFPS